MRLFRCQDLLDDPTPVPEPDRFSGPAFSAAIGAAHDSTVTLIRLDPGVRGDWHRHEYGQVVHVVDGEGMIGRRGRDPLHLNTGDSVWIEAGEEHFHGAAGVSLAQIAVSLGPITWLGGEGSP